MKKTMNSKLKTKFATALGKTPPDLETAFEFAKKAFARAYAPYSKFHVGAAIKVKGIELPFSGCNVENASYGATLCAERVGIVSACANVQKPKFEYLVLLTKNPEGDQPCGLCLQVLSEFCPPDFPIYTGSPTKGLTRKYLLKDFLPYPFAKAALS